MVLLRLFENQNALYLPVFLSSSPRLFRNTGEFGAKKYFTDYRTANTIKLFVTFPLDKITSRRRPEDVPEKGPDVLRTSPYGPIYNTKGRILSGTYSGSKFNHNP